MKKIKYKIKKFNKKEFNKKIKNLIKNKRI